MSCPTDSYEHRKSDTCYLISAKDSNHEVRPHANFPVKIHCMFPTGIIPLGYNPLNQTVVNGKIPVGPQSFRNPESQRRPKGWW